MTLVKNNFVSGSRDDPAGCDEDFSEHWAAKVGPGLYYHIKWWQIQVLGNGNGVPAVLAKGAIKEEVEACFFTSTTAKNTTIVF